MPYNLRGNKMLYKLTDKNACTRNATQWGPGVTHAATGDGARLCSDALIHAYENPLLAVLLNPIHASFTDPRDPRLFEAEGKIVVRDGQLKCGCKSLTTLCEIPLPVISLSQKIRFAIYCALSAEQSSAFEKWAENWLNGSDRSKRAAAEAANAAADARTAAGATTAAVAAANAAEAAAAAAEAQPSPLPARDEVGRAVGLAAVAAVSAAWAAAWVTDVDLVSLAEKAINDEPDA